MPQVEVTFDIDANGILNVTARDKATGKEQKITITSSSGLSSDEVDRLVQEAKDNEALDQDRREIIENRNNLDNLVYQTEKVLSENREKLPASEVETLEGELEKAREALDQDDATQLKAAFDSLTQASHSLAQAAYQDQGGPEAGGPTPDMGGGASGNDAGGDDVIDADFEEA